MKEQEPLTGKHVVVVGASTGLGEAIAAQLLDEGCVVTALSRTIESRPGLDGAQKISCDITDPKDVSVVFFDLARESKRPIDILVNVAGIGLMKRLEETSDQEVNDVLTTNLAGIITTTREAYKSMKKRGKGLIINVSSTSGFKPRALEPVYAASKFGLKGFTESMQMAGKEDGIDVVGVYPGGMNTRTFWKDHPEKDISEYMDPSDVARKIIDLMRMPSDQLPHELIIERPQA